MATACYEDRTLPGSFKGVPFSVTVKADSEHGRRGAEGEFPFSETTAYADLGRRIRTYRITARFAENNHLIQAAALIAACESTGPGVLVHPTRGVVLNAACRSIRVNDDLETEGGVTNVEMEFVEAALFDSSVNLLGQSLGLVLGGVITAIRTSFLTYYKPRKAPSFRQQQIIVSAQEQVRNISREYAAATVAKATDRARNRILQDLDNIASDRLMASDPILMDKALSLGMAALAVEVSGNDKFEIFRRLANDAALTSVLPSPSREMENSIYALVRSLSGVYMAAASLEATGNRLEVVFDQLDKVDAILSQEIQVAREACDNHLYASLSDFLQTATTQLFAKAYKSPSYASYDFGGAVHPLSAAYAIYGDARQHRQLEESNLLASSGRFNRLVVALREGA